MAESEGIGLADAISALQAELVLAQAQAAEHEIQFPIETLTVELKVGVTKSADGRAGFKVPLIGAELGGSAGMDRESTQTITLHLGRPVDRAGRPVKIAEHSHERMVN